ncbi:MAG: glycosyltransferase family 2 protein [Nitrospirae bacterium]|nr:glycosyltransferase family 2 protein [Nitrospirota bacterium]
MDEKYFSVIVPVYNGGRFIERALSSAFEQDAAGFGYEVIVINDGSTDNTSEVLSKYGDRIVLVERRQNRGLVYSVNEGIRAASGPYIIRLDADDEFAPDTLYLHREFLEGYGADFSFSDYVNINEWDRTSERVSIRGNYLKMIAIGIAFKREIFDKAGMYDDMFWEEHNFMLKVLAAGFKGVYIPLPLIKYYHHDANMTLNAGNRLAGWQALLQKWDRERLASFGYDPELQQLLQGKGE